MAGAASPEPSDKKRAFDVQLNMVPFIDLLSVLIAFLLMTSIWTQVSKIEARPTPESSDEALLNAEPQEPPPKILIKATGYTLSDNNTDQPEQPLETVEKLRARLGALRLERPALRQVVVVSEDDVPYESLIQVMDLCLSLGLEQISVGGFSG